MDELSFYATIASLVILQVSFYWLFRDDHHRRQFSVEDIKRQRLAVMVAEQAGGRVGEPLIGALERYGFVIYEIRYTNESNKRKQPDGLTRDNERRMNTNELLREMGKDTNRIEIDLERTGEQAERTIELMEGKLNADELRLHAIVSLPILSETAHELDTFDGRLEWVQASLFPPFRLLASLTSSRLFAKHRTRIIHVQELLDGQSNSTSAASRLVQLFQDSISVYLAGQAALAGGCAIDVKVSEARRSGGGGASNSSTVRRALARAAKFLNPFENYPLDTTDVSHRAGGLQKSARPPSKGNGGQVAPRAAGADASRQAQDERIVKAVKNLILQVNPFSGIVVH